MLGEKKKTKGWSLILHHTQKLKDRRPKLKKFNYKILRKYIGEILHGVGFGSDFWDMTQKRRQQKKISKLDQIEILSVRQKTQQ